MSQPATEQQPPVTGGTVTSNTPMVTTTQTNAPAPPAPPATGVQPPAAPPAAPPEDSVESLRDRLAAATKVNKDLERKFKEAVTRADSVAELEAKVAKFEGREIEYAQKLEQQKITDEAIARANKTLVERAVLAEATGKLHNPADALKFIDVSKFEVAADTGAVDATAISGAVVDLIKTSPYLAAQGGGFTGSADQGNRNGQPATVGEQIAAAEAAGDWNRANTLRSQQLLDLSSKQPTTTST